jgi:hypothetical protein
MIRGFLFSLGTRWAVAASVYGADANALDLTRLCVVIEATVGEILGSARRPD